MTRPFAGDTVIPGLEDGICQLGLEGVAITPRHEIEVHGEPCTRGLRAVWRGGRWHTLAAPPAVRLRYEPSATVFAHFGADTYAARTKDYETAPRALLYACTDERCKLGERLLVKGTDADTPVAVLRAADGALLLWAGEELVRWDGREFQSELTPPVTSITPDAGVSYATAHGNLFERLPGGHWTEAWAHRT